MSCSCPEKPVRIWRERLPGGGNFWASPLYAAGKVYFFSKQGRVSVISASREFQVLAENRFDDGFNASPAVAGNVLILRSLTHLYCIDGSVGEMAAIKTDARPAEREDEEDEGGEECFELVLPLTFSIADGSTITVSNEEGWVAFDTWYESNPNADDESTLQFPVAAVWEDGTTRTIASDEELNEAEAACYEDEENE